ncbi:MAG: chemotaxis protein CheD [Deltaproteobacteria bacterium RBG_13_53_10]|nr:MAG: chemotaxis protein CheD [Deltaproteobacteria bacterium RBG_13_53_10]
MKISASRGDLIVTHALGSCLGVAVHDPVASVGGLLHVMLPLSTIDPAKADRNPFMFVDTGFPALLIECFKIGAQKQRMEIRVAGGANSHNREEDDVFQIGKRNLIILRKLLWKNGLMLKSSDVGGTNSRTMSLEVGSGKVMIKSGGQLTNL